MIDLQKEQLLTLTEACRILPRRRRGRKPSFCTVWRWATVGLRGAILETVAVGGTLCTSREALQRFFDRLTEQRGSPKTVLRPLAHHRAAIKKAEQELDEAGI